MNYTNYSNLKLAKTSMLLKYDKTTNSTFIVLILSSLFINIYTFTSLAPLYKSLISGELFSNFHEIFTHENYLFLMRFLVYFISSSLTGIIVYLSYFLLLKLEIQKVQKFLIIWIIIGLLAYLAYQFHLHYFDRTDPEISYNEYKFRRAMWYIGRALNLGVISIYIANFVFNKQKEEEQQKKLHVLKIENLKYKYSVLKSQIYPRFLYNSIETLNELIDKNQNLAQVYLIELSKLLRYSISENDTNSFEKEIEIAKSFAFIMKLKYNNNTHIKFNIVNSSAEQYLPSFSLQIILEHMINSSVINNDNQLWIYINSNAENNTIELNCNINKKNRAISFNNLAIENLKNQFRLFSDKNIELNFKNSILNIKLPLLR
jgi:sensor histidine kinase YesM